MSSDDQFPPLGSKLKKTTTITTNNNTNNNNNNNNNSNNNKNSNNRVKYTKPTTTTKTTTPTIKFEGEVIDIGANLSDKQFINDIDQVLSRSNDNGCKTIIITGTSINSSLRALELIKEKKSSVASNNFPELHSTCGVHPHDAEETMKRFKGSDGAVKEITRIILENKESIKAVGECGLDFNRNFSSHETQIEMFKRQIQIGVDLGLPLFIHERDAHEKFMEIVGKFISDKVMPKSVVHCFTGTEAEAKTYLANGFYIGITGFISHKTRGEELRGIISRGVIPLDKIMIETDAPYMCYFPGVKGRNEPAYLPHILRTLSDCYKLSESEVSIQILKTTREFFNIVKKI